METINQVRELIEVNISNFRDIDWAAVQLKKEQFAVRAAMLLLAALLFKIVWPRLRARFWPGKERSSLEHSGLPITHENKPGFFFKILGLIANLMMIIAGSFLLCAIADPYLTISGQTKSEESREIVYLNDNSVSMGFKSGNRARGEIFREFLLDLLAGRKGKKDRTAFITFTYLPHLRADFTNDSDSFIFQVFNAPIVTGDPEAPKDKNFQGLFVLPRAYFEGIAFEGGTNLFTGLEAVVKLFDTKGDKKITEAVKNNPAIKRRSVIIMTDGASEQDPEPQFKELQKRHIVPYLIFIDPEREAEKKIHGEDSPQAKLPDQLLKQVRRYGGEYFLAKDKSSREKIRLRLDSLQVSIVGVKTVTAEKHIYRPFLVIAILFLVIGAGVRLLLWAFHHVV
jgi:hypothetical protein